MNARRFGWTFGFSAPKWRRPRRHAVRPISDFDTHKSHAYEYRDGADISWLLACSPTILPIPRSHPVELLTEFSKYRRCLASLSLLRQSVCLKF